MIVSLGIRRGLPLLFLLGLAVTPLRAEGPAPRRVPWTTSRIHGTPEPPRPYTVERVFTRHRFNEPVLIEAVPGSDRLVVAELKGKIWSFADDPGATDRAELAIDIKAAHPDLTMFYGLAFHPQFKTNRFVYLCYVLKNDDPEGTRVSRFTVSGENPLVIEPASERVIITWLAGGHNGGCLTFGNDGYLYISTGDGKGPSPPDVLLTGQDVRDLLSSVLRIDVDHEGPGLPYRIPEDNPLRSIPGARAEIWAYGFRNPWRMSFDRKTGDLWLGDVGWELWEFIFRVERGGNYGWSVVEGRQPVHPNAPVGPTPILPPTAEHPHSEAASITGGYVYRGQRLPELEGVYVYGDYQTGKVWGLHHDGNRVTWSAPLADTGLRLVSFGEDRRGELFLLEYERDNGIYRLIPNPSNDQRVDFPKLLSQTGLFTKTSEQSVAAGVIPYRINAEAWADGERAERFLAMPEGRIATNSEGRWRPPDGTVLARTLTLDLDSMDPKSRTRIETQILHYESESWRPYTYAWNDAQDDATLVDAGGLSRAFTVRDPAAPGGKREQVHRFAARAECALCHNPWAGTRNSVYGIQSASPLAFHAAQWDRSEAGANQLDQLQKEGYFAKPIATPRRPLADPRDATARLDDRARSYLQVNCAHCHQFNAGGAATILLDADLPLAKSNMLDIKPSQGAFLIDDGRIIAPGRPDHSVLLYRLGKTGAGRMPRVGPQRVDVEASQVVARWIESLDPARAAALPTEATQALETLARAECSVADREAAIRCLTATTPLALRLMRAIDAGAVPNGNIAAIAAIVKDDPRAEVRDLFERFLPDDQKVKRIGDAIEPARILTLEGDPERGRRWFLSPTATQCQSCHTVDGKGSSPLGPDLASIGSKYSRAEILKHLIEPSLAVEPRFTAHQVATRNGQVLVGLLVEKSERAVVLRDARNELITIPVAEIDQQAPLPRSLMPDLLLRDLTEQQAADLLAFLASLRAPVVQPAEQPR